MEDIEFRVHCVQLNMHTLVHQVLFCATDLLSEVVGSFWVVILNCPTAFVLFYGFSFSLPPAVASCCQLLPFQQLASVIYVVCSNIKVKTW